MRFGPLELEATGENNFTLHTLGLLAFRPDLRRRLATLVLSSLPHPSHTPNGNEIGLLFFSKVGENFLREYIERAPLAGRRLAQMELRLKAAIGLPQEVPFPRKSNGSFIQPSSWQDTHMSRMVATVDAAKYPTLTDDLGHIQNWLNTEPDMVLHWEGRIMLVEVKVLSDQGVDQLPRQERLGRFIADMLEWNVSNHMIGPDWGATPGGFVSWRQVMDEFADTPSVAEYIRDFRAYYQGAWRSMLEEQASPPIDPSAFDKVFGPTSSTSAPPTSDHFSRLGSRYFERVLWRCIQANLPMERLHTVWLGASKPLSSRTQWLIQDDAGVIWRVKSSGTSTVTHQLKHWKGWRWKQVSDWFDL